MNDYNDLPKSILSSYVSANTINLSQGDQRYYGSLIPPINDLKKIKLFRFEVNSKRNSIKCKQLDLHNNVNVHLFKPKYFTNENGEAICVVPNMEVLAHTIKGLYLYSKWLGIDDIGIEYHINNTSIPVLDKIKINNRIVICRVESIIQYMFIEWLLEIGIDFDTVRKYSINFELNRLKRNLSISKLDNLFKKFKNDINYQEFDLESDYFIVVNLKYKNNDVTLIQLTWGESMAEQIATAISKEINVKKCAIIGGVAYIGPGQAQIDDIFIPTGILNNLNKQVHINNRINESINNKLFANKSIWQGLQASVTTTFDCLSNSEKIINIPEKVNSIDMELSGFIKGMSLSIELGLIYYIMDLPYQGIGLGETYYNYDFLYKLFSNFNRGKYYCFEKALNFIIN